MAEVDKISFKKPLLMVEGHPVPDPSWNKHEQLIEMLVNLQSERRWEDYVETENATTIYFEYKKGE